MSHVLKYKRLSVEADGNDISPEAQAIFIAYDSNGRIESVDNVKTLGGEYVYIRFIDEETADAYLAELNAINESGKTGKNRTNFERYNEN